MTAGDLLAGWRTVIHTWPGARWHTLTRVSARGEAAHPATAPMVQLAFPGGLRRALLIAGTHGDEPAGPRALLRFFASGEATARRSQWSFDVLPLVNPLGFDRGTRGRRGCPDLNRAFGTPPRCPETAAILAFVAGSNPTAPDLPRPPRLSETHPTSSPHPGDGRSESAPRWDLALSLHEDLETRCLYCYDTGDHERHRFAAALQETTAFLDWAEAHGTPVCAADEVDGTLNRGGLLIAAQQPFPALEPLLFRTHRARRVVILETPGHAEEAGRERLHVAALRHFLRVDESPSAVAPPGSATVLPARRSEP